MFSCMTMLGWSMSLFLLFSATRAARATGRFRARRTDQWSAGRAYEI